MDQPRARAYPWGALSLTLGVCAAVGVPVLDAVTMVPGYLQSPILILGGLTGVLAIGSGIGAAFARAQRTCGVLGACLGIVGLMLIPALARA